MSSNDPVPFSPRDLMDALEGDGKRSCGTCEYSVSQLAKGPNGETIIGQQQLTCMRRPPQIIAITQKTPLGESTAIMTQFPPVTPEMYCFDYWPEGEPLALPDDFDMVTGERMDS